MPLFGARRSLPKRFEFWMEGATRATSSGWSGAAAACSCRPRRSTFRSLLAERLFDAVDTVVLTSATLAVAGGFEFAQQRLGLRIARRWWSPSHFDYQKQALLYVPQHLPEPRNPAFTEAAARRDHRDCSNTAAAGRSCCSPAISRCGWSTTACRSRSSIPTLLQGTGPRNALLDEFRSTPNCVLFATSSFWQGVDVPGEQLSCVIIDKLPFAVPNDPVVEARIAAIRERRRQSVLRLPDPAGGHRAQAGIRTADPQQVGPRRAGAAGQPDHQARATARSFSTACRITDSR